MHPAEGGGRGGGAGSPPAFLKICQGFLWLHSDLQGPGPGAGGGASLCAGLCTALSCPHPQCGDHQPWHLQGLEGRYTSSVPSPGCREHGHRPLALYPRIWSALTLCSPPLPFGPPDLVAVSRVFQQQPGERFPCRSPGWPAEGSSPARWPSPAQVGLGLQAAAQPCTSAGRSISTSLKNLPLGPSERWQ